MFPVCKEEEPDRYHRADNKPRLAQQSGLQSAMIKKKEKNEMGVLWQLVCVCVLTGKKTHTHLAEEMLPILQKCNY